MTGADEAYGSAVLIGLPKGSLNRLKRDGQSAARLYGAGFMFGNYAPDVDSNEIPFENFDLIRGVGVESQRSPELLYEGQIDGLIAGEDWAEEFRLRGKPVYKLVDLGFGRVKLVAAAKAETMERIGMEPLDVMMPVDPEKNEARREMFYGKMLKMTEALGVPLLFAAENPYKACNDIVCTKTWKSLVGELMPTMIGATGDRIGNGGTTERVVGRHTVGQTEAELDRGAHYIVECTQSGKSFDQNGIAAAHVLMESQAALWVSERTRGDGYKMDVMNFFAWMMKNARPLERNYRPETMMEVEMNVIGDKRAIRRMEGLIVEKKYCQSGPTVSPVYEVTRSVLGATAKPRTRAFAAKVAIRYDMWPKMAWDIWRLNHELGLCEDGRYPMRDINRVPVLHTLE